MKSHDMRDMTLEELRTHYDTLLDELVHARVKLSMRQLDNPMRVRVLRREVARAKTVMREKELGAGPGQTLRDAKTAD